MTLIQVIDAARALLNEPLPTARTFPDNTSSFWTDGILTSYHNLVQEEVQQEIIQADEDYFTTANFLAISAGTAEYNLHSNTIKVRRVEDVRGGGQPVEIRPVHLNQKDERFLPYPNSQALGAGGYYLKGGQIILTDTPTFTNASAIRVHFIPKIPDCTTSSDVSEIPREHHRVLVWGIVKHSLFQQQSDITVASAEYEKHLSRIRQEIENRQTQRPRRVASALSGWGD